MPPTPIEVADRILIYSPSTDKWSEGYWNIFTDIQENLYAPIHIHDLGDNTIIEKVSGKTILITTIILTVGGEVDIIFKDGDTNISGPMDFGGTGEPKGMVSNFGQSYLPLSKEKPFVINLSATMHVGGMVGYKLK